MIPSLLAIAILDIASITPFLLLKIQS